MQFNLGSAGYQVSFSADAVTKSTAVQNDTLTFSLGNFTYSTGRAQVGTQGGQTGNLRVTGAGQWRVTANSGIALDVGLNAGSTGILTIQDGGQVISGFSTRVGSQGNGTVNVTGTGSQFTTAENLLIGTSGTGNLSVSGGGAVTYIPHLFGTGGMIFLALCAFGVGPHVLRAVCARRRPKRLRKNNMLTGRQHLTQT